MGMSDNMLACIRAIAENRIQDAKQYAICCCVEDGTKKNEGKVQYYKKLLENGSDNVMEVPMNIKGLVKMIDVSDFNESRYYLGKQQADVFTRIIKAVNTTTKLLEYGIPYTNSTLLSGIPGTGKTEFAKYTAYKLKLPYVYLNFSYLIDSYMGKTSQNIQRVFDFCKGMKCVLMLDEIDWVLRAKVAADQTAKSPASPFPSCRLLMTLQTVRLLLLQRTERICLIRRCSDDSKA